MCFQILRHRGDIPSDEWALFLRGSGPIDRSVQPPNPHPGRLTPAQWDLLYAAEILAAPVVLHGSSATNVSGDDEASEEPAPPLQGLCDSIRKEWERWMVWADSGDVLDTSRIPGNFFARAHARGAGKRHVGATTFHQLLLVRAFREDQLLRCIAKFVGGQLGNAFAER